jgi:hypothetical protein
VLKAVRPPTFASPHPPLRVSPLRDRWLERRHSRPSEASGTEVLGHCVLQEGRCRGAVMRA